jgi:chromosome segregation ATPase
LYNTSVMKRKTIIIVNITFIALLFLAGKVLAKSPSKAFLPGTYTSSYEEINTIKIRIGELVVENKKLQTKYDQLKSEYDGLYSKYNLKREKILKVQGKDSKNDKYLDYQKNSITDLTKTVDQLKSDVLLTESKVLHVKGRFLDLQDKETLLKLKLADLDYEKQEKELDVKVKKGSFVKVRNQYQQEIGLLQKKLEEALQHEENLKGMIIEIEGDKISSPAKEKELKLEIGQLQQQLDELQDLKNIKHIETSLLENKILYAEKSVQGVLKYKREKKISLAEKVEKLEGEYVQLAQQIETSLSQKQLQEDLVEDVIAIDKENQHLKDQILKLQKKVNELN